MLTKRDALQEHNVFLLFLKTHVYKLCAMTEVGHYGEFIPTINLFFLNTVCIYIYRTTF